LGRGKAREALKYVAPESVKILSRKFSDVQRVVEDEGG
jgi:hypothetical protein